jgi:monomeric isocitrate dehydrogenase
VKEILIRAPKAVKTLQKHTSHSDGYSADSKIKVEAMKMVIYGSEKIHNDILMMQN